MQKIYRLIFDKEDYNLHTKVKSIAPLLGESMKDFMINAIKERIEKFEKEQAKKSSEI